jgi:hypothetical protein
MGPFSRFSDWRQSAASFPAISPGGSRQPRVRRKSLLHGGLLFYDPNIHFAKALFSSQKFSKFSTTSNLWSHAWSIKYR